MMGKQECCRNRHDGKTRVLQEQARRENKSAAGIGMMGKQVLQEQLWREKKNAAG